MNKMSSRLPLQYILHSMSIIGQPDQGRQMPRFQHLPKALLNICEGSLIN